MKSITARKLRKALQAVGLRPASKGSSSGHEVWTDPAGRICHPVLRHHDLPWQFLVSLTWELEGKGICSREAFFQQVRTLLITYSPKRPIRNLDNAMRQTRKAAWLSAPLVHGAGD